MVGSFHTGTTLWPPPGPDLSPPTSSRTLHPGGLSPSALGSSWKCPFPTSVVIGSVTELHLAELIPASCAAPVRHLAHPPFHLCDLWGTCGCLTLGCWVGLACREPAGSGCLFPQPSLSGPALGSPHTQVSAATGPPPLQPPCLLQGLRVPPSVSLSGFSTCQPHLSPFIHLSSNFPSRG